uniref:Uncharacterized protein n=1 Tax=Rubrivivax gelatinosus TaxID=28068 RepID=Q5GBI0_RUBGE|nr:hypothetical protein [Rubrivivax gelatinosus]
MKIQAPSDVQTPTQPTGSTTPNAGGASAFASMLAAATNTAAAAPAQEDSPEFTGMTRQELFDWMNRQIRSGKMSLDESTPFLGMTMKVSVATGEPVDMASDGERVDFVAKARGGIAGALERRDFDLAARLQGAVDLMLKTQGMARTGAEGHKA